MAALTEEIGDFPFRDFYTTVELWVFRKRKAAGEVKYTGGWVATSRDLERQITSSIVSSIDSVKDIKGYGIVQQNHETSALSLEKDETYFGLIDSITMGDNKKQYKDLKKIQNIAFYAVKFINDGEVFYGVKASSSDWMAKNRIGYVPAFLQGGELKLEVTPHFQISRYFDFFVYKDKVFMLNKNKSESILNHTVAYLRDFSDLSADPDFKAIFDDRALDILQSYVGDDRNKLRRAAAIKQKGLYKDAGFVRSLKANLNRFKYTFEVDDRGNLVPDEQNAGEVFQALLNHRLMSHYNDEIFDVTETQQVE